ncbi:hypothetical protein H9Q72_002266 [Fusarium xylarioides]|uniref:Uncharacterized protein n=1 Tax=Fusarium xylarioides TaxID=221167 RepID=A0A9P7I016_9HYPO|nr:hypothetical protein H9Q72_002266 [Fusarium xylarioides]
MPRHSLLNASSYGKVAPSAHSPASLDKRWGSHANLAIASIDKGRHYPCSDEKTDSFPSAQVSSTKGPVSENQEKLNAPVALTKQPTLQPVLITGFSWRPSLKKSAMPLVPSSAPLPSSMTTIAYLREQEILNIVYIGLLVIEVLMVLGVITMALVKRVKVNHQLKTIRSATTSTKYAPYHFAHADTEKTML